MSANTGKTREEILAERAEKKKKKAALKNQPKGEGQNKVKESGSSAKNLAAEKDDHKKNLDSKPVQNSEVPVRILSNQDNNLKESVRDTQNKQVSSQNVKGDTVLNCENHKKGSTSSHKENILNKVDDSSWEEVPAVNKIEKGEGEKGITKSKAQLKAERRAKQEAERARKLEKTLASSQVKKVSEHVAKPAEPVKISSTTPVQIEASHKVKLFAHLYNTSADSDEIDSCIKVHPAIIQLRAQYSSKVVSGSSACCLALLNALKKVVTDFETPQNQEFSRGLEAEITKSMSYLNKARPIAVSMSNAVKHLKFQITQAKGNKLEIKNDINDWIDTYIRDQLEMAAKAICLFVREKIAPGDVILTYGCTSLIQQILISVHNEGINFQVIVVDGRPWLEGREMLKRLVSAGIHCTYVFVNGLSFIMPEVTKILLGADALLANGYVMSRAGSSQIALLAKTYNVPVLVCCETHKFSERVQTDSFVHNELGNPDDLVSNKGCLSKELSKWKSIPYLTPLNLTYDVTPPDLVSAVVTEIAVLPCTSVPVILRIKPPDVSC